MPPTVRLGDFAHARSGDKGNHANVGVVPDDPGDFDWLGTHLTEARVADFFRPLGVTKVRRYALPGITSFNFVLENALAGGASRSLRLDTQGKALGTAILELRLSAPTRGRGDEPA